MVMTMLRVIDERATLEQMVPAWRQLVARCDDASVVQTPEWALGWWRAFAKNSKPFALALFAQERLVGFAPLYIESHLGARVLRFMGPVWDETSRALVEPAYARTFNEALTTHLRARANEWDVLQLAESETEGAHATRACAQGMPELAVRELSVSSMSVLQLSGQWDMYWKRLAPKRRQTINRDARRLQERGAVSFHVITAREELERELERFYRARFENWRARKRLRRMVLIQRTRAYYDAFTAICLDLAAHEQVWLARLDVDDRPAAWDLGFCVNRTFTDYLKTFDVEFSAYGPGFLTMIELLRYALARGIERVELGRGAQPYKTWLRATAQRNVNTALYWKRPLTFAYVGREIARAGLLKAIHQFRHGRNAAPQTKEDYARA